MRDQPELSDAATASGDGPDRDPTFGYAALSLVMALAGRSVSVDQLAHDGGGRAADAAQQAGAHEFILQLPQAYDTVLGERGATLSGGQRQRIALARALATNPRLLILDEATSALDSEAELAFRRALLDVRRDRTVIAIAHRLSTVREADRVLVVEGGQIIEHGSPTHLLSCNGRFAQLWRLQQGDLGSITPGQVEISRAAE